MPGPTRLAGPDVTYLGNWCRGVDTEFGRTTVPGVCWAEADRRQVEGNSGAFRVRDPENQKNLFITIQYHQNSID